MIQNGLFMTLTYGLNNLFLENLAEDKNRKSSEFNITLIMILKFSSELAFKNGYFDTWANAWAKINMVIIQNECIKLPITSGIQWKAYLHIIQRILMESMRPPRLILT